MSAINTPPNNAAVDQMDAAGRGVLPSLPWQEWFMQVFRICFAVQQSGTTAQRPTSQLWIGRTYFDTTLNKPVWVNSSATGWVDADGSAV